MRVALDTNVLVSAIGTRGLCADLMRLVLRDHELVVGEQVLLEPDVQRRASDVPGLFR